MIDGDTFRRQCASALTHPVTLASIGVLLLNDIVFKSLWPGTWVTGKLSDLAWVVFASPLLAFLLSFVVGSNRVQQRGAFLASYVGLPLLYAAFNTFEPVHYWILRGISLASGGTAGSPLDVTDSLVIPFGLGIALWVWRRGAIDAASLRLRFGLLVAVAAALASVASTPPVLDDGIVRVGTAEDGFLYAEGSLYDLYRSQDGGLTWALDNAPNVRESITWGDRSARTPSGRIEIGDAYKAPAAKRNGLDSRTQECESQWNPHVLLVAESGESEVIYSLSHLSHAGNNWVQEHTTTSLGPRSIGNGLHCLVYDDVSRNLVATVGTEGVLVRMPHGEWRGVAVGPYSPSDFSFWAKTRLLLSTWESWATILGLSLGASASSLAMWRYPYPDRLSGLFCVLICLSGPCALLITFGGPDLGSPAVDLYEVKIMLSAIGAFFVGSLVVMLSFPKPRVIALASAAFVAMIILSGLMFMLWLHVGISLALAKFSSAVLTGLVAAILWEHLSRRHPPGFSP